MSYAGCASPEPLPGTEVEGGPEAAAYGWEDLELGHGFHETPQGVRFTIDQDVHWEVLDRLLELSHKRHEEEVRQGVPSSSGVSVGKVDEHQTGLF